MRRREALKTLTAGVSAAASALWVNNLRTLAQDQAPHLHTLARAPQANGSWAPKTLTPRQFATVGVLVDLIIPATDTPGAKAALVDRYVDAAIGAAAPAERRKFLSGLQWIDRRSRTLFRRDFVDADAASQTELLTRLSDEGSRTREAREGLEFFQAIKALTIAGYYTTEIGLRQELGDDGRLVAGSFEGCTHPEHGGQLKT